MGGQIFYNIFSETDPVEHARMKKPIAKYFTSAGVLPMEPHVSSVLCQFVKQLEKQSANAGEEMGAPFDFGEWIMYCSCPPPLISSPPPLIPPPPPHSGGFE